MTTKSITQTSKIESYTIKGCLIHIAGGLYAIAVALEGIKDELRDSQRIK